MFKHASTVSDQFFESRKRPLSEPPLDYLETVFLMLGIFHMLLGASTPVPRKSVESGRHGNIFHFFPQFGPPMFMKLPSWMTTGALLRQV